MEIKISKKPVKYEEAIEYLDERVHQVSQNKSEELIWFLEHKSVYTCGVNFNQKDILDKNIIFMLHKFSFSLKVLLFVFVILHFVAGIAEEVRDCMDLYLMCFAAVDMM